jgi:hypothetical protein
LASKTPLLDFEKGGNEVAAFNSLERKSLLGEKLQTSVYRLRIVKHVSIL